MTPLKVLPRSGERSLFICSGFVVSLVSERLQSRKVNFEEMR
jgi:hypothetical protein